MKPGNEKAKNFQRPIILTRFRRKNEEIKLFNMCTYKI